MKASLAFYDHDPQYNAATERALNHMHQKFAEDLIRGGSINLVFLVVLGIIVIHDIVHPTHLYVLSHLDIIPWLTQFPFAMEFSAAAFLHMAVIYWRNYVITLHTP